MLNNSDSDPSCNSSQLQSSYDFAADMMHRAMAAKSPLRVMALIESFSEVMDIFDVAALIDEATEWLSQNWNTPKVQKARRKAVGRPSRKLFKDLLVGELAEEHWQALKHLIKGHKGKDVAFLIRAAKHLKWLSELPSYESVKEAFGEIGAKSGYNKYMKVILSITDLEQMVSDFGL